MCPFYVNVISSYKYFANNLNLTFYFYHKNVFYESNREIQEWKRELTKKIKVNEDKKYTAILAQVSNLTLPNLRTPSLT